MISTTNLDQVINSYQQHRAFCIAQQIPELHEQTWADMPSMRLDHIQYWLLRKNGVNNIDAEKIIASFGGK